MYAYFDRGLQSIGVSAHMPSFKEVIVTESYEYIPHCESTLCIERYVNTKSKRAKNLLKDIKKLTKESGMDFEQYHYPGLERGEAREIYKNLSTQEQNEKEKKYKDFKLFVNNKLQELSRERSAIQRMLVTDKGVPVEVEGKPDMCPFCGRALFYRRSRK